MTAYEQFVDCMAQINDLCCVINLLAWDARTQMPEAGIETRGHQVSTLARLAQEMFTDEKTLALIEAAENELARQPYDVYRIRAVQQARQAYEIARRIPIELVTEINSIKTIAEAAWVKARANDDFPAFAPLLERMVGLQRRMADVIGYQEHPYDALVSRYEPGMTASRLRTLFAELKEGLAPIRDRAIATPEPRYDFLTERDYPEERQRDFALEIVQKFGYDLKRGRLDKTVHPFEISFTRQDVRITTRYHRDFLPAAIFGTFHEAGHALYEQGAAPELTRSVLTTDLLDLYAVGGVSYGTHESQSRLWENLVGRSLIFWQNHYNRLQEYFPDQLNDIDVETFYRAINRVKPSLIRVEADEVTYNYHIMLRVEIEIGLMDGSLQVKDLPEIWRAKMREYLGVTPPNNRLGPLQDIHWSTGYIGSFPTYTIGNIMSSQFYDAASRQVPDLEESLAGADYRPLLDWLTENIYRHARTYSPDELLRRSTGSPLTVQPYINYLKRKYFDLFPGDNRRVQEMN